MPELRIAAQALTPEANIRVGLEDSIWIARGALARSNADQVRKARALVEAPGLAVATPEEARAILGLKGGDKVGF
ncbi:MAG: 3-keto-5-aminohexanoate cleavage protein [Rhodobacterales bacterium]|nr:3-keto-5-aminohexanoate cleavage protein [Rhodobacterales bacterium]